MREQDAPGKTSTARAAAATNPGSNSPFHGADGWLVRWSEEKESAASSFGYLLLPLPPPLPSLSKPTEAAPWKQRGRGIKGKITIGHHAERGGSSSASSTSSHWAGLHVSTVKPVKQEFPSPPPSALPGPPNPPHYPSQAQARFLPGCDPRKRFVRKTGQILSEQRSG